MDEKMIREAGIEAIIRLQKFDGKVETRESAEKGWDGMSPTERQTTMYVNSILPADPVVKEPAPKKRIAARRAKV